MHVHKLDLEVGMSDQFEYVEINDNPFKIDSSTSSPVSRLVLAEDRQTVVEVPLTDKERLWYWDRAENYANLISEKEAKRLASEMG